MHRYIVTSSGREISVSDYDVTSGGAKGGNGKLYKIEGSVTERDVSHD